MHFTSILVAMLAGSALGHISIVKPAPLRSKENPHSGSAIDYNLNSPLSGMSQFPCKGALDYLGKPEGASVETYAPGGTYDMVFGTGAAHDGGSCQISLSYDKGKTFTVIKSIIGGCAAVSATFKFTVPSDAPLGEAVFSWSWNNHSGNREFYQNCAVVTIAGGAQKRFPELASRQQVAFSARPQIFVSNLGGEYCTPEGIDVVYPNPGPDVERNTSKPGDAKICATGADVPAGSSGGGSSGGDSGSGNAGGNGGASSPAPSSAKPTTGPTSAPAQPAPAPTATAVVPPGGVFITVPATESTAASTAAPTTASPTTLQTQTSAAASSVVSVAPTSAIPSASSPPAASSSGAPVPAPSGAPPAGGATGGLTGPCTSEGEWNCIAGSSFQRCASGAWSAVIPMAAGTTCQPGTSSSFVMKRIDFGRLRARRVGVWN